MIGLTSRSSVVAASPAASRAHWYSATVSRKNDSSSPSLSAADLRRCSVMTSARPGSSTGSPAGPTTTTSLPSAAGRTTDNSRLLESGTDRKITRISPGILLRLAESCTAAGAEHYGLRAAEMRLPGGDDLRETRSYSSFALVPLGHQVRLPRAELLRVAGAGAPRAPPAGVPLGQGGVDHRGDRPAQPVAADEVAPGPAQLRLGDPMVAGVHDSLDADVGAQREQHQQQPLA